MSTSLESQGATTEAATFDSLPGSATYLRAMNVLTIFLVVVALGGATQLPRVEAIIAVVLCALFILLYGLGVSRSQDPLWLRCVWLCAMSVIWVLMLPIVPVGVYLLFPLFFLFLRVFPDIRGIILVVGATVVAVLSQWGHITVGAVVGPAVSALVVIGIHFAFVALWKASLEREQLLQELILTRGQLAESERSAGIAMERQRIAHEIHDTIAQGLSSIQMLLRVAEQEIMTLDMPEEHKAVPLKRMALARQTAADNLQEARAMIAALQPATLSKTSLEGALSRVAESLVGPEFSIAVVGSERNLPMKVEAALLRIAQGAMGNVAKHSGATACMVTLTYEDNEVRLDVVDNGQGFDPAAVGQRPAGLGHIGIDAMRQRARELGGEVVVESAPGEGTAVSVALPLVVVSN